MSVKRGQAGIITTVVLILVGLAAISLVAVFINSMVKDNIESAKVFSQISDISIKELAISEDNNFARVLISAGSNNLSVNSTEIVLTDDYGKTQIFDLNESIEVLESRYIYIPLTISFNISKVGLYPVLYLNGKKRVGNLASTFSNRAILLAPDFKEPNGGYCLSKSQCNSSFCNSIGVCSDKSLNSNCGINNDCTSGFCNSLNHICSDGNVGNDCASNSECLNSMCGSDNICGGINSLCENVGEQDSCNVNLSCGVNYKCTDERCGDGTCNNGESHSSCEVDCPGLCDGVSCSYPLPNCVDGQCCFFVWGCQDPCADINCNSGWCSYGSCNCDIGYTGSNCEIHVGYCGDGSCDHNDYNNEDAGSCYQDCHCGDNNCDSMYDENAGSCYVDCHNCGDGICDNNYGEDCNYCFTDCGSCPYCGDYSCNNGETCGSGSNSPGSCQYDCGICGNGVSCSNSMDCNSGYCENSICGIANGNYCSNSDNCQSGFCNSNYQCSDKSIGSNCNSNYDCNSGYCDSMYGCQLKPDGYSCSSQSECVGGYCFSGPNYPDGECFNGDSGSYCTDNSHCDSWNCDLNSESGTYKTCI